MPQFTYVDSPRDHKLQIRLTEEERAKLDVLAMLHNSTVSEWIREKIKEAFPEGITDEEMTCYLRDAHRHLREKYFGNS
jgi:predicted DNA-binding protein